MTVERRQGRYGIERAISRRARRPQFRARPVRPAALADQGPARAIPRDRSRRARDPPDAGRRHRQRLARPSPPTRACWLIAKETAASAEKSVRLTRLRLEGGIAPRTDLSQAEQILEQAQADLAQQTHRDRAGRQCAAVAGRRADRSEPAAGSIDEAFGRSIAEYPPGSIPRPAAPARRRAGRISAARRQRPDRRGAGGLVPAHHADRPARLREHRAHQPVHRRHIRLERWRGRRLHHLPGGRGQRQRPPDARPSATPPIATYQQAIQTAFREVADALARRGTINDEIAARQRQQVAAADTYTLDRSALSRRASTRSSTVPRRAAVLLFVATGAGADQAHRRARTSSICTRRSAATRCCRRRRSVSPCRATAARATQSSRANARPYSRRRYAAARRRDDRRRRSGDRALVGRSNGASSRQHHARLRFSPSRCAILPSLRSLTIAGVNRVAGCAGATRGRNCSNQIGNSAGWARAMHKASISAGERNSSPPGSHAWQSRSSPNQSARSIADRVGERGVEGVGPFERQDQRERGVEMRSDADRIGQDRQIVAKPLGESARQRLEHVAQGRRRAASPRGGDTAAMPSRTDVRTAAQRPLEIGELDGDLVRRETFARRDRRSSLLPAMSGNSRRRVSKVHQPWTQLCQSKLPKKIG